MNEYPNKELDSELIIGLVGAVGTELKHVIDFLEERFLRAGFEFSVIKISKEVIPLLSKPVDHGNDNFQRIWASMDAGNAARTKAVERLRREEIISDDQKDIQWKIGNAVLAYGAAAQIFDKRTQDGEIDPLIRPKNVYIIDSLKRPEEVEQLRLIYPSGFVLIGVHAEQDRRRKHLIDELGLTDEQVTKLFERDGEEKRDPHGQQLNKTFHHADFFVSATSSFDRLRADVKRIVEVLFGNPFLTPTFDEYAMFMAFAAALRSADLSRQVGAVITKDREILSTGANDCPRFGGGQYWPERCDNGTIQDEENGRDYTRDEDSNRIEQIEIVKQIMQQVSSDEKLREYAGTLEDILNKSRIRDLTEFGRVVHAEMAALLACARNGISTVQATLYCTTFPCHNCAKHIVCAGLHRVVYVEPYQKSKATEFHNDSIVTTAASECTESKKVRFEPFVGIGPRRFFDLFSMHLSSGYDLVRKDSDTGKKRNWSIDNARLRLQMNPQSFLTLEAQARTIFGRIIQEGTNGK